MLNKSPKFVSTPQFNRSKVRFCTSPRIKSEIKKPISLYTGREFEILPDELLDHLCMVVCGPYRQDLHQDGWRASSNQRVFKKEGDIWKS